MTVLVGTASWTDKTLIACGRFYPKQATSAEARLRFYASQFPLVEVDSSYYAMPAPATSQLWAERTPRDFTFNIKAFRIFTGHQTSPAVLHRDLQQALGIADPKTARNLYYADVPPEIRDELWRRFREALEPLARAEKLALVHFQFPPWMLRKPENRAHIEHCVERMAGYTVSVEFRHRTWLDDKHADETLQWQRELGVVHTVVDAPQGPANAVPAVWATTHPRYALVRLHGRNLGTWNIKDATSASDRFNYDYTEPELGAIAGDIDRLASSIPITHVVFNNNMEDQGQRNAKTLMGLLKQGVVPPPDDAGPLV